MELEEFIKQAATPDIGIYAAKLSALRDGYHFELVLDGLNDPKGAVHLSDCEEFSARLASLIDETLRNRSTAEEDPLPRDLQEDNYTVEVSSAGAERELRLPHDLLRFKGLPLKLKVVANQGKGAKNLGVYSETKQAEDGVCYIFEEYIPKRRRNNQGRNKKVSFFEIQEKDLLKANLYLDF